MTKEKTFNFSTEELNFLKPRQSLVNQYQLMTRDLGFVIEQFIVRSVLSRIAVDPTKEKVTYNINEGTLSVSPLPPEIIVPNKEIVKP